MLPGCCHTFCLQCLLNHQHQQVSKMAQAMAQGAWESFQIECPTCQLIIDYSL